MKAASRPLLVTVLLGAGLAVGDPLRICPSSAGGVCYRIAIPTSSADAGSGNIYFQISAPTSFQWVALGTGQGMPGSNIFLIYQDGTGNVTLSPRLGQGYTMPRLNTAARLTLLAGSGVSTDGTTMTANVVCSNCQTWAGGEMALSSTSAGWIAAWKQGPSIASTDRAANIVQHDGHSQFSVDLTRATINSDSDPFSTTPNAGGGNSDGGGSGSGSSSGSGSGSDSGSDSGSGSGSGSGFTETTSMDKSAILAAHGIIMALVMAVLYPLGSLLMPLIGKWWLHGIWQAVAYVLMWAGFGVGIRIAQQQDMLFRERHTILGTVVVVLMAIQPALGILHHRHYVKTQGRGLISYVHIWWGRVLMALGVINGGLGLVLSGERDSLRIAYGVVAAITFLVYSLFKGYQGFAGRARKNKVGEVSHKDSIMPPPRRPYQAPRMTYLESKRRREANV